LKIGRPRAQELERATYIVSARKVGVFLERIYGCVGREFVENSKHDVGERERESAVVTIRY